MPKLNFIPKTESARIILQTVAAVTLLLLIPSIFAMTFGTRMIIKEEVGRQVNQALDGIAYRIDNTLLGVEQVATLIQKEIPARLDNPQDLYKLCEEALNTSPYIDGCAIALNPDYYTLEEKPFMAYVHRARKANVSSQGVTKPYQAAKTFTSRSFTEQEWYTEPLQKRTAMWVGPLKNEETEEVPLISYDVPIMLDSMVVGVLGVDMSLNVLTRITRNNLTSSRSHIALLDKDGSYIIHPDSVKLHYVDNLGQLMEAEAPEAIEVIQEMLAGKSGERIVTLESTPYLVAYKPFLPAAYPGRTTGRLGWSIATIYPESELNDQYDPGFHRAIFMALVGVLLLVIGAIVIFRISVRPLKKLMYVTQFMSKGDYEQPGVETTRTDEIGRLQTQYYKMQHAVSKHMEELQSLSQREAKREEDLARTHKKTQEIKEQKAVFFGNMTHQMADVTSALQDNVEKLCDSDAKLGEEEKRKVFDNIEIYSQRVTDILNDMLNAKS